MGVFRQIIVYDLELQAFQVFAKRCAQIFSLQGEFHGCLKEAEFVAGIMALPSKT